MWERGDSGIPNQIGSRLPRGTVLPAKSPKPSATRLGFNSSWVPSEMHAGFTPATLKKSQHSVFLLRNLPG